VIVPSFNFPSAAGAVVLAGASPVFADVDFTTMSMGPANLEKLITPRTRAIISLAYGGFIHELAPLADLAKSRGIALIEDGAHGLGVSGDTGKVGSFGCMATYSFHETKNVQCGEGGALQINDEALLERAQILREKGTNRAAFRAGQVQKYEWILPGSSWLMSDLTAAILLGSLENFEDIQKYRTSVVDRYREALAPVGGREGWHLTPAPQNQEEPGHLFGLVLPTSQLRSKFIRFMKCRGITVAFHYQPLDTSPASRSHGWLGSCPNSAELGDRLVRLPLFYGITEPEQAHVITSVNLFLESIGTDPGLIDC
jgi:dTDP-4-amino-4,6-dideoxygalactose transaminase